MSHTTSSGASSAASSTSSAAQQASEVGQHAAGSAQHVAGVAQQEAASVASEAGDRARDLLGQGREQLRTQASAGQQRAASGLDSLASELRGLAEGRAGSGVATHLASQASDRVASVGSWLRDREPADVLTDVQDFARRRPGAFLAIAAGVGVVAGRLTRGLGAAAQDGGATSPRATTGTTAGAPVNATGTTGTTEGGPAHRAEPQAGLAPQRGLR